MSESVPESLRDQTFRGRSLRDSRFVGCDLGGVVVRGSDIVVTTTPAKSPVPVIQADWLHPGLHITAMGSDAEEKNEIHPKVLARADLLVCDRRSQCLRLGELHHRHEAGWVRPHAVGHPALDESLGAHRTDAHRE